MLTPQDTERLLEQGRLRAAEPGSDLWPVVKVWAPRRRWTWLLGALDPSCPDAAFGLCDLARGWPELGLVRLQDLADLATGPLGPVVRDGRFVPKAALSTYLRRARWAGFLDA